MFALTELSMGNTVRGMVQVSSGYPVLLPPGSSRKCSVTVCNHTEAKAHEDSLGYDTSKSDHKTVARKHKASNCREGIGTAAV